MCSNYEESNVEPVSKEPTIAASARASEVDTPPPPIPWGPPAGRRIPSMTTGRPPTLPAIGPRAAESRSTCSRLGISGYRISDCRARAGGQDKGRGLARARDPGPGHTLPQMTRCVTPGGLAGILPHSALATRAQAGATRLWRWGGAVPHDHLVLSQHPGAGSGNVRGEAPLSGTISPRRVSMARGFMGQAGYFGRAVT